MILLVAGEGLAFRGPNYVYMNSLFYHYVFAHVYCSFQPCAVSCLGSVFRVHFRQSLLQVSFGFCLV